MRHAAGTSCCQLLPVGSVRVLIFFFSFSLSAWHSTLILLQSPLPHSHIPRTPLWYDGIIQVPPPADNRTLQRYKATSAELCMTYAGSMHSYLKSPK